MKAYRLLCAFLLGLLASCSQPSEPVAYEPGHKRAQDRTGHGEWWPYMIGRVVVNGTIIGKGSDGTPSIIRVGTGRWVNEWPLKGGEPVEEVLERIVADLKAQKIDAIVENKNTIKIVLDDAKDRNTVDCSHTDEGLTMISSLENSPSR